jgi:hypothetical protein
MPVSYYNQLKAQLDADAIAKKTAIDSRLAAYTQAMFDASGNVSYKEPGKLGTRDVQYDTSTRNIKASGESSGTLRSGQQARNLATNLASYKADIVGASGEAAADKSAIDTTSATELAKYQATYGTGSTATPAGASKPKDIVPGANKITPAPGYKKKTTTPTKGAPQGPSLQGAGKFTPKKSYTPTRIGGY